LQKFKKVRSENTEFNADLEDVELEQKRSDGKMDFFTLPFLS
jgi:hypothetical protein